MWNILRSGIVVTEGECRTLAERLARMLPIDCTLLLSGDLGTGKTTFVRGLALGWGIVEPVTSPTFTLMNIYRGDRTLVHVDAYRLTQLSDLYLEEFCQTPYGLVIEWPERVSALHRENYMSLQFDILSPGSHKIVCTEFGLKI